MLVAHVHTFASFQIQMTTERSFKLENLQYLEFFPMLPTWDQPLFQPIEKFKRNTQVLTH